ncbi:MAG: hypothetical protein R3B91_23790 [Planctomycetaceae bacterium]
MFVVVLTLLVIFFLWNSAQQRSRRMAVSWVVDMLHGARNEVGDGRVLPVPVFYDEKGDELYSWRYFINVLNTGSAKPSTPLLLKWDSEEARHLRTTVHPLFCGSDSSDTTIMAVTGEGTAFDLHRRTSSWEELDDDTILIVDFFGVDTMWAQPGDISLGEIASQVTLNKWGRGVANDVTVGFADGKAWTLSGDTPTSVLRPFLLVEEAFHHEREIELLPYRVGE